MSTVEHQASASTTQVAGEIANNIEFIAWVFSQDLSIRLERGDCVSPRFVSDLRTIRDQLNQLLIDSE